MSKIRSLSFPDTNAIDMGGGRFEIYGSEIIDRSWGQNLTNGFGDKWNVYLDGGAVVTTGPYTIELGGEDGFAQFDPDDLIDHAVGVYGFKFRFDLNSDSDSGVGMMFLSNATGALRERVQIYYSPQPSGAFCLVGVEDVIGGYNSETVYVEETEEVDISVLFFKEGGLSVRFNGAEIYRANTKTFKNVFMSITASVDGGPYPESSFFTPVNLYVKPYLENIPSPRHFAVKKFQIVPDNVQDSYISFPFTPTRPGQFNLKLYGIGVHAGGSEDFEIEVIDNYSMEDNLRLLVSPIEKMYHDSDGLLACRTHGIRRSDNVGSMSTRMECICDGTPQNSDAVHVLTTKGGDLSKGGLGSLPEFHMVDKTDPIQPKTYGRDYQFLRIHSPGLQALADPDDRVRHSRTLILQNGNRLYYGIKYKPEESFTYSFQLKSNDSQLLPETVTATRMTNATLGGMTKKTIDLPKDLNQEHSIELERGVWLIQADFRQLDSSGIDSTASIEVKKTSGFSRDIGKAVAFASGVPDWDEYGVARGMRVSVLVEVKETVGGLFYILADRCDNVLRMYESPYYDVDMDTESFSAIEEEDGGVRFFYLEYDGKAIRKNLSFRKISDLLHCYPFWTKAGNVMFQTSIHADVEPTGFSAFDMVRRDGNMVDLIFSQVVKSDYYYDNEYSQSKYSASLAPNVIGDYKIVSLDMTGWMLDFGIANMVIPVNPRNVSYRSLPTVVNKQWRGASFYRHFTCQYVNGYPDPYCEPIRDYFAPFKATPCFIRANYDKDSGRTVVSMLKSGDRAPFLICGRGGSYSDLASVDTDRDMMVHGLINWTDSDSPSQSTPKARVFSSASGTEIRSVDSAFGPDGFIYTVCTAYTAYGGSEGHGVVAVNNVGRFNTWLTLIDPLILSMPGSKASPDATGFARGQVQVNVPIFNIYGSDRQEDCEIFTSMSIASDGQYLITGAGSSHLTRPMFHQGSSHDGNPLATPMDEVWIPEFGSIGEWTQGGGTITESGVLALSGFESLYRPASPYLQELVKSGGGIIYYVRFDTSSGQENVDAEIEFNLPLGGSASAQAIVSILGNTGQREVWFQSSLANIKEPIDDGVYDLYLIFERPADESTTVSYVAMLKKADHANQAMSGRYSYDFRRNATVVKGLVPKLDWDATDSIFINSLGTGKILIHEVGWAVLNSRRSILRRSSTDSWIDGETGSSSYPSRGVPNTASIGNSASFLSTPHPSFPFTMSNMDGGQFRRHHWPNGFIFWPEHGATFKGDSSEISRQVVYREEVAPSSRIHNSWRSVSDTAGVHIWADAHDSGIDTFSANAFVVSGANVPFVTVVAKDNKEDPWEVVGNVDLVRYRFEEMVRTAIDGSNLDFVYSFEDLSFNLGKFEDIDHYLHPISEDMAWWGRSEKVTKARFEKVWTRASEPGSWSSRDPRFLFSSRGVLKLEAPVERRFIGFRFAPWSTYEGYFKFDNLDFGMLTEVPLLSNHDIGGGLKSSASSKTAFVEDNQVFSLQDEGIDREFNFSYSITSGALFMKFVSVIDKLTFSRVPIWIIENHKSKPDSVYLCLATGDANTQVLVDEDGDKFYNVDLKFKSVRRDL